VADLPHAPDPERLDDAVVGDRAADHTDLPQVLVDLDQAGTAVGRAPQGKYNSFMDYERTREVLAALEREKVEYAIFGGVALNLQGLARATEDLDIFIAPSEENIHRLRVALMSVFHDPHIDEITADDLLGEYPAVQYVPPEGAFHIDGLGTGEMRSA
jgi:hypothetical protein